MSEEKMSDDRLTAIIAIRVTRPWKERAKEEAKRRGKSLSDFLWNFIDEGWQKIVEGTDVKQEGKSV